MDIHERPRKSGGETCGTGGRLKHDGESRVGRVLEEKYKVKWEGIATS
jgi:hypothetical protein